LRIVLPKSNVLLCVFWGQKDSNANDDGTRVSMLVEDMSRIKCFSRFEYHVLCVIYICDLFTESPSYLYSGDAWFESMSFAVLLGRSRQMQEYTSIWPLSLPSKFFLIHESAYHFTPCTLDDKRILEEPHIQNNCNSYHRNYCLLVNMEYEMNTWKQEVG
jgi:hypothetical protein